MIGRMEPNPELEESIYAGGYTHNKAWWWGTDWHLQKQKVHSYDRITVRKGGEPGDKNGELGCCMLYQEVCQRNPLEGFKQALWHDLIYVSKENLMVNIDCQLDWIERCVGD
jgi:hypothetical protein